MSTRVPEPRITNGRYRRFLVGSVSKSQALSAHLRAWRSPSAFPGSEQWLSRNHTDGGASEHRLVAEVGVPTEAKSFVGRAAILNSREEFRSPVRGDVSRQGETKQNAGGCGPRRGKIAEAVGYHAPAQGSGGPENAHRILLDQRIDCAGQVLAVSKSDKLGIRLMTPVYLIRVSSERLGKGVDEGKFMKLVKTHVHSFLSRGARPSIPSYQIARASAFQITTFQTHVLVPWLAVTRPVFNMAE